MTTPKKKKRNFGCMVVYFTIALFIVLGAVNAGQNVGLIPKLTPLPTFTSAPVLPTTAMATATPVEFSTVSDWLLAPDDFKRTMALAWTQQLSDSNLIETDDVDAFGNELYDCVNETIGPSPQSLGENYLIDDVVATCALLLNQ